MNAPRSFDLLAASLCDGTLAPCDFVHEAVELGESLERVEAELQHIGITPPFEGRERMSEHRVCVIEVAEVRRHDNADRLEIVPVNGWQAVVKVGQFKPGDRAVYIEPDYTVPTDREEFAFLAKEGRSRHRLKAVRLRGALSFGLLIPLPDELSSFPVGADVMTALGIERYEPPIKLARSDELPENEWPRVYGQKFDMESLQRFANIFIAGEPVIVTEKIHGANARYVFHGDVFYMGSRSRWLKPDAGHPWRVASSNEPRIEQWCRAHPDIVLYGEIFGAVQSLKYGTPDKVRFAAFAANEKGQWLETERLFADATLPTVPVLYRGPYEASVILPLAELDSSVPDAGAGHMREGIVIVPAIERRHEDLGRVALKHVSARYWESAA